MKNLRFILVICIVLCACSQDDNEIVSQNTLPRSFYNGEALIGSHRGHYIYPENTYEGIKAAIDAGFMIVEFDIQMTKDSVLVLHHDLTVDRCSNGTGIISELDYNELNKFDYGVWKDEHFSGIKMATLESILKLVKSSNVLAELDLLSHSYDASTIVLDKTYELVKKYGLVDKCSFNVNISNVKRICELSNNKANVSIQFPGHDRLWEVYNSFSEKHFTYLSIRKTLLTGEIINECKKNGIRIEVFGPNTQKELDSLLLMGCDYVMVEEFVPNQFHK